MRTKILSAAVLAAAAGAASADLETDFAVGFVGDTGELAIEFNFSEIEEMPFVSGPGFTGWASDEPGFANIVDDEPAEDFFALAGPNSLGTADIAIEIVAVDPGFRVIDPLGFNPISGEPEGYIDPGSNFVLGTPDFDDHPFWSVDINDWDGSTQNFDVTFKAIDLNGVYGDSVNYTVTFAIPTPGTAGLLALGGLAAARRRR